MLRQELAPSSPTERWLGFHVRSPADDALIGELADGIDFRVREDYDRTQDAYDPGELLEHATLNQFAIEVGDWSIEAMFVFGDELFEVEMRPEHGLGNNLHEIGHERAGTLPAPNMRRVHSGEFGGPDSLNCATCHLKGGPDGAGNPTQNAYFRSDGNDALAADERNPPQVIGLGPIQALANEMSADLTAQRDAAVERALAEGIRIPLELSTHGISFGGMVAFADGTVDLSPVDGVDEDLIIKPFGWKGHQPTLRGIADESFRIHIGMLSSAGEERARNGIVPLELYGGGPGFDLDNDGIRGEVEDGMLTTIVAYLSQLESPVIIPPSAPSLLGYWADGRQVFQDVQCDGCHSMSLELRQTVISTKPTHSNWRDSEAVEIDVARDGEFPKIEPVYSSENTPFRVELFSDLKRHDMGPELAAPMDQGEIPASVWLTRPLWGLAETSPYLHDGRAITVGEAIEMHGGEAAESRDFYLELELEQRQALQIFLLSLTRTPKLFVP